MKSIDRAQILREDEKHGQAKTPQTAESFGGLYSPHSFSSHLLTNQKCRFINEENLFEVVEKEFEAKFLEEKDWSESSREKDKVLNEEISNSFLRIKLEIYDVKRENLKRRFEKTIREVSELAGFTSLIFESQHEKVNLPAGSQNLLQIFLTTQEGFERKILTENLCISEEPKKWETFCLRSENKKYEIFFQSEFLKENNVKPLGMKLESIRIEEFLNEKLKLLNKSEDLLKLESIRSLKGILYPLSKQNMGSRIIQKLLCRATHDEIQLVARELQPQICNMVADSYGNYVVQKMFKVGSISQKTFLISKLGSRVCELVSTKQGTHCIQILLDTLNFEMRSQLFQFVRPELLNLCLNQFGHHFIIKMLPSIRIQSFLPILLDNFAVLAKDRYGIVVLKNVMKVCHSPRNMGKNYWYTILHACQENFNEVAYEEYGHYIIVELFQYYNIEQLQQLLSYLSMYISYISLNQFSSAILKKSIELFGDAVCLPYIDTILSQGVQELMESKSGTFILHRLMESTSNPAYCEALSNSVKAMAPELNSYEKRQKWMKFFGLHY